MTHTVLLPPDEQAQPDGIKAAGWWHASDAGPRVVCDLCPRACSLGDGDRGFCFVRQNLQGRMALTTYGRSTGFCIDPIEKKPLNQFYPGTAVLSFGTAGCNLGCKFCQNWSMSKSRETDAAAEAADPATVAHAAQEIGCRSVAFTYNDPTVWAEYAIDTARECRRLGVKTVAVTAGYITPLARTPFYEVMDAANVDLKGFSEDFYWKLTGGHLDPVLDTLRWLAHETDVWLEITNLVIPRANDRADEMQRMCEWILKELGPDVPVHFSAFHPDFHMTDREPTPRETLERAHEIACAAGLHYVYTGNLSDEKHQSTYCPGCRRIVIERDGYTLGRFDVAGGCCGHCGTRIAGRFDDRPGDWGARRQPVRIGAYAQQAVAPRGGTGKVAARPAGRCPRAAQPIARPKLTSAQEKAVFRAASYRVAKAVRNQPSESLDAMLGDAAITPVYGTFVTLKRAGQLRSCCGFMGQSLPLNQALEHSAVRAAKDDPRFPPISPSELEHLEVDVWLLWGLEPVTALGEDRVGAVVIGKHGLQIARGPNRGLLLPGVAIEHKLDARRFLEQVCLKAGLPPQAWRQDDTVLMTFEGYAVSGPIDLSVAGSVESAGGADSADGATAPGAPTPAEVEALATLCRNNLLALLFGATPSYYLDGGYDGAVCGAALAVALPDGGDEILASTLSLRAESPLQSTLFNLVQTAAGAVARRVGDPRAVQNARIRLSVFRDPALHGTADAADLSGIDARRRAVLVRGPASSAWIYDPAQKPAGLVAEAIRAADITDPAAAQVASMAVVSTAERMAMAYRAQAEAGSEQRPPAWAGSFYPGAVAEINRTLDEMLSAKAASQPWAAAMVPHAGWIYSGRLAAATLSRVQIPNQVIIFCPRHRPGGAQWAVAPHRTWMLPNGTVQGDPELARHLAQSIAGLELDAAAHRQEHAIEVQLPILARLAPQARVVGIAVGGGSLPELLQFGGQLAGVLRTMPERPLLVISSDMNHYADELETRRRDQIALEAMLSLDPARLYETVLRENISMCGMMPAVIVMETLRQLDLLKRSELVDYTTSAAASGDTARVVGYAGVLLGP